MRFIKTQRRGRQRRRQTGECFLGGRRRRNALQDPPRGQHRSALGLQVVAEVSQWNLRQFASQANPLDVPCQDHLGEEEATVKPLPVNLQKPCSSLNRAMQRRRRNCRVQWWEFTCVFFTTFFCDTTRRATRPAGTALVVEFWGEVVHRCS
jgi:hypothetical protein